MTTPPHGSPTGRIHPRQCRRGPLRILADISSPCTRSSASACMTPRVLRSARAFRLTLWALLRRARELARLVTNCPWIPSPARRFSLTGCGAHYEAANRGATDAGRTIGSTSVSQRAAAEPVHHTDLCFDFHYFFMLSSGSRTSRAPSSSFRRLRHARRAVRDLTLPDAQLERPIVTLLYGPSYWQEIVNFPALVRHGMIAEEDLGLLEFVDTPGEALARLRAALGSESATTAPSFARSRTGEGSDDAC